MPYGISNSQSGCSGWATVKKNSDGSYDTLGCHSTKQDAIDQMVAVSIAEGLDPLGEVNSREARAENEIIVVDIDDTLLRNGDQPIQGVIDAVNATEYPVFILTGRSPADRDKTVQQLQNAGVNYERLIMNSGEIDVDSVAAYKADAIAQLMSEGYTVDAFVDNQPENLTAVGELNVPVFMPEDFVTYMNEEVMGQDVEEENGNVAMRSDVYDGDSMETKTVHWVSDQIDERRSVAYTTLELRAEGDSNVLHGYAALFDSPSEPMPFVEYVRSGAFTKTLNDGADVRLLIDHEGVPLARTKSGTLMLEEDSRGLRVEASLDPMNPDAQRVLSALRRGDLSQMSFAFRTIKDSWNSDRSVRELKEVQLFDVSVVTYPAYEDTVVSVRSKQTATVEASGYLAARKRQIQIAKQR
jgi:uncharacterized protein